MSLSKLIRDFLFFLVKHYECLIFSVFERFIVVTVIIVSLSLLRSLCEVNGRADRDSQTRASDYRRAGLGHGGRDSICGIYYRGSHDGLSLVHPHPFGLT